jgi:uncharacterized protein (TIGR00266 family)
MKHRIAHGPTFTTLEFDCVAGDAVTAQPGSMLAMTPGFDLTARAGSQMKGNSVSRAARSLAVGESFFAAIYTAKRDGEQLLLAPDQMGDIRLLEVNAGNQFMIASGAFLACTGKVELDATYVGVKGLMTTRALFLLKASGEGQVFVSSYGAFAERTLAEGERFVLDNRYIISFSEGMKCEVVKVASSLKHSVLSGEGLVNRFTGPGKLLYQTRARPGSGMLRGLFSLFS